ncbi:MAG: hypothetical protein JWP26_3759 [Devosia sp.]|nr:hypothetical protein [Devosia sp.]MDB5535993.1 hypothetical protein [Devosia sp.]MDB5588789.1 hypothetical protein [Devosia sp.]
MRILWTVLIVAALAVVIFLPKDFTLSEVPRLVAQGGVAATAPKT